MSALKKSQPLVIFSSDRVVIESMERMRKLIGAISLVFAVTMYASCGAQADQTNPELDELFQELKEAESPANIKRIENRILDIWRETESDSIDLLMNRAIMAMAQQELETALIHLDDVVELAPDYAEGWNRRATLLYVMERYEDSIIDIERTVSLEPRHYGAWSGLGNIFVELGRTQAALKAYEEALSFNPHLDGAKKAVESLTPKIEERGI